jgi:broad specificity phosphatase PhoE
MKVALIPCGTSDWRQKGRLLGRVELEPAADVKAQCTAWSAQLRSAATLHRIFYAPDGLSKATAQAIARELNIPAKPLEALVEVDLGLWAGLTEDELKTRFSKAHRQLVDSPLNVRPPNGEDFSNAAGRVRAGLKKRIKPNGKQAIGLVMRPLAFAMARCALEGSEPVKIWEISQSDTDPLVIDCDGVPEPVAGVKADKPG